MRTRNDVFYQLISLASMLDASGEDKAASNIRLALKRLSFLQYGLPKQ